MVSPVNQHELVNTSSTAQALSLNVLARMSQAWHRCFEESNEQASCGSGHAWDILGRRCKLLDSVGFLCGNIEVARFWTLLIG